MTYWYGLTTSKTKLFRFGYEAVVLLKELMNIDIWRSEILNIILKTLDEAYANLKDGKALPIYQIGAIEALAIFSSQVDIFGNDPIELAEAKLFDSKMKRCIITKIDENSISIYSPVTDEIASIEASSIAYLRTINNFDAIKMLTKDELKSIKDSAINLLFALNDLVFLDINIKPDRTASLRILYAHLEYIITNEVSLVLAKSDISDGKCENLLKCLLKHAKAEKITIGKKEKQLLLKQIMNTIVEKHIYDDLTDEEVTEIFANASGKIANLIEELKEENIDEMIIAKCLQKGIKDKEKILEIVNECEEPKPNLLFKLQKLKSSDLIALDIAGDADIYQNSNSHFIIENSNFNTARKQITTVPDLSVFRSTTKFVKSLTILAQLEGAHFQNELSYGLRLGGVDIGVSTNSGSPCFEVNGKVISSALIDEVLVLRIYLYPNGKMKVVNGEIKESIKLHDNVFFNGLQLGEYGLYIEAGTKASLLTFDIYEGKNTKISPTKISKSREIDTNKRIQVIQNYENYDRLRLKLLGLSDSQVTETLSSGRDLRASLDYISQQFPNNLQNAISELNEEVITDLKLVQTIRQIPSGFSAVPIYEYGIWKEYKILGRMVLCFKKEKITEGDVCTSIKLGKEYDNYTNLGNLDPEDHSASSLTSIWLKKGNIDEINSIKDIIFIKSSSIHSIKVPFGYNICKDDQENAINLGCGAKGALYLAVKLNYSTLECPFTPFKKLISSFNPECGLLDTYNSEIEVQDNIFESLSTQELFNRYFCLADSIKQTSYKKLIIKLIKKCSKSINTIAETFNVMQLFDYLGSGISRITKNIDNLLYQDDLKLKEKIINDCLERMLKCLINNNEEASSSILTFESEHPFENETDFEQEIRIKGAKRLRIVFDERCETEKNCDYLTFYWDSDKTNEIASFSGSEKSVWTPFEVAGDVVYLHFKTDITVTCWGYKFDVIPEFPETFRGESPLPALWILNKISRTNLFSEKFTEIACVRYAQPLFLFSLSASALNMKPKTLNILSKIIRSQQAESHENILNILMAQANSLYNTIKENKTENDLMQAAALLLEDSSHNFQLKNEEPWLKKFCELVLYIKGLSENDERLEIFLFESFKKNLTCLLERPYKSEHPYIRKTKKQHISIPGASSLSITFDQKTDLDPRDTIIFSYDEFGEKIVDEKIEAEIIDAKWRQEPCGSKIVFWEDASQVSRVKGTGWGNAIWSEDYSDGIVKIRFKIESDGNSEFLYIGAYKTEKDIENYDLDDYIGCDCRNDVWSWKKNGEVHKNGWFKDGLKGFEAGDEIIMLIDMNLKELTFFNGDIEVYKFTEIASSITPVVCFGALHQVITVVSVERINKLAPLSEKNLEVIGDSVYYWISSYDEANVKHKWDSNQNEASLSQNKTALTKLNSGKTYHEIETKMSYGKYCIEVSVESKEDIGVGFTKMNLINENNIEEYDQTKIYYNSGKIGNIECESYGLNDIIGAYINFDKNEISFYKNNKLVETIEVSLDLKDSEDCFKFIAVLTEKDQKLSIRNIEKYPEGVDLMKIDVEEETEYWGYKFTVTPNFKKRDSKLIESYLSFASAENRKKWRENYKPTYSKFFKKGIAKQFIEFIDEYLLTSNTEFDTMRQCTKLSITKEDLKYYPDLQKLSASELFNLKEILFKFCSKFQNYFYLFNLHDEGDESENPFIKYIKNVKGYILPKFKKENLYNHINSMNTNCRVEVIIDKNKAQQLKNKGKIDSYATDSIFSQISRALGTVKNHFLRNNESLFKLRYKGEPIPDEEDQAKYKVLLINATKELQSPILPLLIPSNNNILNVSNGRDNWIINPTSTLPAHMHLFTTLGKFFGSAIRTKVKLSLSLPIIFFKHLLYEDATTDDLKDFDFPLYQFLHKLRNLEAYGITPENFSQHISEKFIVKYGEEIVELCENGANIDINFENASNYADLLEKHKLFENKKAYDVIRKGMSAVVPIDKLNLFTASQLRELICETNVVKIEVLEENTIYEDCQRTDSHIENFWEAIKSFNEKEIGKFIECIARRSKLIEWDWPHKFTIARYSKSGLVNTVLPIVDNINCRLELPAYTTPEIMKEKIIHLIFRRSKVDPLNINY